MKHLFSFLITFACTTSLFAYDCKVDGIYYNLNSTGMTAEVTNETGSYTAKSYSGTVIIPSSITYESKIYSVTTIGNSAFSDCYDLTSITIPNTITTIGDGAFQSCSNLTVAHISDLAAWCMIDFMVWDSNPLYHANHLYLNNEEITELTIPSSITEIKQYAFENCEGLISVNIPSSITKIGLEAFYGCHGLTTITIPNSVIEIGESAFRHCFGLTSITIPNSVTTIGSQAFSNCYGLTSATIGNSVTAIGNNAFDDCRGLTSVTIPNSVTTIGSSAFSSCSGLTTIEIPNSVTTIGDEAFNLVNNIVYSGTATGSPWGAKCVNGYVDGYLVYSDASKTKLCGCSTIAIGTITIPSSVTTIGEYAFYGCSGVTSIDIPNSVTTIGEWAFYDCGLTSATIPSSVKTIRERAFFGCITLTSIIIPNSVTTIESYAFYDCDGLTEVTIPNSVTTIGSSAFGHCSSLISVSIGKSVTEIGEMAFLSCTSLTSIKCFAVSPPWCDSDVFLIVNQDAKVYVLASSLRAYQSAKGWKNLQLLPLGADETPIDGENPIVTPSDQDVTITWPITDGTDTYTLTITKGGEVVCVLTFNANGQLVNIAFKAPATNGSSQAPAATLTAQGYQFTVTGLTPGTAYNYSVVATDAGGKTIAEHKGNFSTTGGTGIDNINWTQDTKHQTLKYLHNGQLLINRNGQHYSAMGERIR